MTEVGLEGPDVSSDRETARDGGDRDRLELPLDPPLESR
jgi:hypothetical protein